MLNLSEEKVKEIYLKKIEEITNTTFNRNDLPGGIEIALLKLISIDPENIGVASEKLNDMSQTFNSPTEIYKSITIELAPYCRPHLISDKRKRPYRRDF